MKTLVLAPFDPASLDRLRRRATVLYEPWTETRRLWDPSELAVRIAAEGIEALVGEVDFFFEELFEDASPLRFVAICRAALNQVDVDAATRRGIAVVNTPSRNAQAVAELAVGLLLALVRRIPDAHAYVRAGEWREPLAAYENFRGRELRGSTLGVVGLGAVGSRVARMGRGLGMRVLGFDPYVIAPRYVRQVGLDDLLREADAVSLHAPQNPETRSLVDARGLALMKPTAYLVNTASHALVDADALTSALEEGRIAGAAVDVFATHPVAPRSRFLTMPNAVLTPHIGGATEETVRRYSRMVVDDLLRFQRGRRPHRLVNAEVWPADG